MSQENSKQMQTKGYITSSGVPLGIFSNIELVNVELLHIRNYFQRRKQNNQIEKVMPIVSYLDSYTHVGH